MTSAASPDSIHEHMTRLRLKLVQQKLAAERERLQSYNEKPDTAPLDTDKVRYHRSLLRRQELLQKLGYGYSEKPVEYIAPNSRTHSATIKRTTEPHDTRVSSRQSLPDFDRPRQHFPVRHSPQPLNQPFNIEDRSASQQRHFDGRQHFQNSDNFHNIYRRQPMFQSLPQENVSIPQSYAVSQPQQILFPANTGLVMQGIPSNPVALPTTINLTTNPGHKEEKSGSWNKGDYMEMMMLQNCQMHQYAMQQLMLQKATPTSPERSSPAVAYTTPIVINTETSAPNPQLISMHKKPSSVHHHHYSAPQLPPIQPQVQHIQTVPLERHYSPKVIRPAEVQPHHYPTKVIPRTRKPRPKPASPVTKFEKTHPFPGSRLLRKLRHVFYAAWFIAFLRVAAKKRLSGHGKTSDKFVFGIQLKEAVSALHRIYLNPGGNIYPILRDVVADGAIDLTDSFTGQPKQLQELVYILENLAFHITDIMPKTGVLGTHRKAAVYEMMQKGKLFPDGYFWQVEEDMMDFDSDERTLETSDSQALMLLLGLFLSRSLVTTLLMKPLDYGLSMTVLDETGESNLRLLSSLMLYIIRMISVPKGSTMMSVPIELSRFLYSDDELKTLVSKIKKTVDYVEELLREWGKEYISRLRAVTR